MIKLVAVLALAISLPAAAKQHQDTLSEADDSAPGLESFGYAEERLPTYEKAPQKRLLTGETVAGFDKNKTKVVSKKQKNEKNSKKSSKKDSKLALGKSPVEWVDLLEQPGMRKQQEALEAAIAAEEEKKGNLEALGVKEVPKDKGDKKNAANGGPLQKKEGDLAGLSTKNGPGGSASGGEAPAPKGAALKYTNINKIDNGTTARIVGDNLVVDGRSAEVRQVPITGANLQQFQQSKYFQENVAVSLSQAFGVRDPAAANIVAYEFTGQPRGLTSFFGITPDRFSYYYPTSRQTQLEMLGGQDAQLTLVFYERRADGTLMPIAGGGGGGGQQNNGGVPQQPL